MIIPERDKGDGELSNRNRNTLTQLQDIRSQERIVQDDSPSSRDHHDKRNFSEWF